MDLKSWGTTSWWVSWVFFLSNISQTGYWKRWQPRKFKLCTQKESEENPAHLSQWGLERRMLTQQIFRRNCSSPVKHHRKTLPPPQPHQRRKDVIVDFHLQQAVTGAQIPSLQPWWFQKSQSKDPWLSSLHHNNSSPPMVSVKTTWRIWISTPTQQYQVTSFPPHFYGTTGGPVENWNCHNHHSGGHQMSSNEAFLTLPASEILNWGLMENWTPNPNQQ